jgi:hypothetical protein
MRLLVLLTTACICVGLTFAQADKQSTSSTQAAGSSADNRSGTKAAPLPLEMRVPFEPTAFPSGPHVYLMYELHLTNYQSASVSLTRIQVLDADALDAEPIASFEAEQLESMLQPLGGRNLADRKERLVIAGGQSTIAFMCVTFERNARIPNKLVHRVSAADSAVEGTAIGTHHTELHLLGPPVEGANWLAADGPSNDEDNHHRRGVVVRDGQAVDSRRYAVDWKQVKDGVSFSGDARDVRSYYSYGKPVLAVADGRVIAARDGLPDNIPGHFEAFHPAVPITPDTFGGNTITLDLGGGQFAHYHHLQPGSLLVKAGDRVRRGQVLAHIGCSGDAREPHLHFEVTTSSHFAEGVPYLIDHYRCMSGCEGGAGEHVRELPMNQNVIDFGEDHSK